MKRSISLLFIVVSLGANAGEIKYPVSEIPAGLKENVDVVIREDKLVYTIIARGKAREYIHEVVTIMNEKGKGEARKFVFYDKLTKIKSISGAAYDATGKVIKKLKTSEIYDQSAIDNSTLYSDSRVKVIDLTQANYPYTVDVEYEVEYNYLFRVPGFYVLPGDKATSQHAVYELQYPASLAPHYRQFNIDQDPQKGKTKDGLEFVRWEFADIKSIVTEPMGPMERDLIPRIVAAPSNFEYDGYVGNMDDWDQFGKWIGSLNKNRNDLPEETKIKVRELTANISTTEEKVKVLYEYMQGKTRYVGIQLGIGGFQPFQASVVDKTGYGDCKALSNYMVSMLEVIGIKANYTLITAGRNAPKMTEDFPSSQFNHATVFVPNQKDTIWLECTSQTKPFGYAGTFTGDRTALAITDDGARIVRTPQYTADQNLESRSAEVYVTAKGDAQAKIRTKYSGLQYETGYLDFFLGNQYDDQKKWIQKNTDIPSFEINSFSMKNHKDRIPSASVDLDLTLNRYAQTSGKRLFLTPNLMNRSSFIPEKVENRKSKVILYNTYTDLILSGSICLKNFIRSSFLSLPK